MVYIEKVRGVGAAIEDFGPSNPFYAGIGLRVEPEDSSAGIRVALEVELGALPLSFHVALAEAVRDCLSQGLAGWQVTDCLVTITHTAYDSVMSAAGDFRRLLPLVLMRALARAGTEVCEPLSEISLEIPLSAFSAVIGMLGRAGAKTTSTEIAAERCQITAVLPAASAICVTQGLADLTAGDGTSTSHPAGYRPVVKVPPPRPRTDGNPLNRQQYLAFVAQHR